MNKFQLPSPGRSGLWIFILVILKVFFLPLYYSFFLNSIPSGDMVGYVFVNKDFDDYYNPVINLVKNGIYEYEEGSNLPYAGRLPGYLPLSYLAFILFDKVAALHFLVVIQLLVSVIASYLLAVLVYNIARSYKLFLFVLLAFNLFSIYSHYDITFHPTSLGNSFFIAGLFFLYSFYERRRTGDLLSAGFFLTWAALLRPFLLPSFIAFSGLMLVFLIRQKYSKRSIIKSLGLFLSPFLIFEVCWTIRNYKALDKFVPLIIAYQEKEGKTMSAMYPNTISYPILKLRDLISGWGGDNLWYLPGTEMNWFLQMGEEDAARYRFKDRQLCSAYNQDSLVKLRNIIKELSSPHVSRSDKVLLENKIIDACERYTQAYRQERWGWYYFISPALRIKNLIFRNAVQDWPGLSFRESGLGYRIYKVCCLSLYLVISGVALLLLPYLVYHYKKSGWFEISVIFFYLALLFTFAYLINFAHWVYFYSGIPLAWLILAIFYKKIRFKSSWRLQTGIPRSG